MKLLTLFLLFFASLHAHDEIIVCENSVEMYLWDLEFIEQARQSIDISACFSGGEVFRNLLRAVEKRIQEYPELQVYILATPVLLRDEDTQMIERLQKWYPYNFHLAHAACVMVVSPDFAGIDNHVKLLVVDETYYSMGGTNMVDGLCTEGLSSTEETSSRDQDIVGKGSMARRLRVEFHKLFALWEDYNIHQRLKRDLDRFSTYSNYFPVTLEPFVDRFELYEDKVVLEQGEMRAVFGGPAQQPNQITQTYIDLIDAAEKEVVIGNLYFSPTPKLMDSLQRAAKRGVQITLITNGMGNDAPPQNKLFAWANRISFVPLIYGRGYSLWQSKTAAKAAVMHVDIFEYDVPHVLYHKKVMVVDGKTFVIGSYNLGRKSHLADYELVCVIDSEVVAQKALKILKVDLQMSKEITAKQARSWYFNPLIAYWGEVQKRFHGFF